jgi:hypothetical protein
MYVGHTVVSSLHLHYKNITISLVSESRLSYSSYHDDVSWQYSERTITFRPLTTQYSEMDIMEADYTIKREQAGNKETEKAGSECLWEISSCSWSVEGDQREGVVSWRALVPTGPCPFRTISIPDSS